MADCTANDKLRILVEKWRNHNGRSTQCAEELETIMDEDDEEPGDWREEIQTRDAAETCPECGADLVESLGSDPACPSCGWSS